MPQIIAITTTTHYTKDQRAALKADIEAQLDGIDLRVIVLPVGAGLQNTFAPALPITVQPSPQASGVSLSTIKLELDTKDALDAVAALLKPGAVLLSAEAVAKVYAKTGASERVMCECGGILSTAKPGDANTTGPEGSEVIHVEDAAEPPPIHYVYLTDQECSEEQRMWAVGVDDTDKVTRYAIPTDQLTEAQMVEHGARIRTL